MEYHRFLRPPIKQAVKMEKFRNHFRSKSARLRDWDYGAAGFYFVTICTQKMEHYFGKIIAEKYWLSIPDHHAYVRLCEFIVMPNHIHGLLHIDNPDHQPWQHNQFGPQSQNLGSIIRGFKATVSTYAKKQNLEFAWQPRYHDMIIHGEENLMRVERYIINNPIRWYKSRPSDV